MPDGDKTGPYKGSIGSRDGRGREKGGRGQTSEEKGSGSKTGGKKGGCD